jgi:hypothetical protein
VVLEDSHTCYLGVRDARHAWGYGCGACPACELRARGWAGWIEQERPALRPALAEASAGKPQALVLRSSARSEEG